MTPRAHDLAVLPRHWGVEWPRGVESSWKIINAASRPPDGSNLEDSGDGTRRLPNQRASAQLSMTSQCGFRTTTSLLLLRVAAARRRNEQVGFSCPMPPGRHVGMRSIGCETRTRRPHALSLDCELPRDSWIVVIVGGSRSEGSVVLR